MSPTACPVLLWEKLFQRVCTRGLSGLSKPREWIRLISRIHFPERLERDRGWFWDGHQENLTESQYNILKGASWKFWAYGEVVTREGNSKHWERKYLWKAAATAYLCEIIMAQNKAQGLPVCSWMGSWKNKRKKKEADVYNCSFRRCLLALQGWRLCSHEKECFKPQ